MKLSYWYSLSKFARSFNIKDAPALRNLIPLVHHANPWRFLFAFPQLKPHWNEIQIFTLNKSKKERAVDIFINRSLLSIFIQFNVCLFEMHFYTKCCISVISSTFHEPKL